MVRFCELFNLKQTLNIAIIQLNTALYLFKLETNFYPRNGFNSRKQNFNDIVTQCYLINFNLLIR